MLRKKTRRWRTSLDFIIGSRALWGSPSSDSRNIGNECSLWWIYKPRQPSNSSCKQGKSTTIRTSSTINDTMSSDWDPSTSRQWSNNKYTITCLQGEVGWTIVKAYDFKQVSSTWNRHNNSQWTMNRGESNRRGSDVVPSSTHGLIQRISLWDFQLDRPKIGLGDGAI